MFISKSDLELPTVFRPICMLDIAEKVPKKLIRFSHRTVEKECEHLEKSWGLLKGVTDKRTMARSATIYI